MTDPTPTARFAVAIPRPAPENYRDELAVELYRTAGDDPTDPPTILLSIVSADRGALYFGLSSSEARDLAGALVNMAWDVDAGPRLWPAVPTDEEVVTLPSRPSVFEVGDLVELIRMPTYTSEASGEERPWPVGKIGDTIRVRRSADRDGDYDGVTEPGSMAVCFKGHQAVRRG